MAEFAIMHEANNSKKIPERILGNFILSSAVRGRITAMDAHQPKSSPGGQRVSNMYSNRPQMSK